ncbi:hypothetical protein GCM10009801_41910 [Streptomyces albiaxialis]|uniref:Uncharacterized protein n=1 Tax=Streptomyces albiaxialis TaxID=329523 RepID=A0ABN2W3T3_9ACTN
MGDRRRWLRYVIRGGPGEWRAEPADPQDPEQASGELWERARPLVAVSHPWGSGDPGRSLSYGRLPDGTGLLCSAGTVREGGTEQRRVDALHLPEGDEGLRDVWPIDAWRSRGWETAADAEVPPPEGEFTHETLVAFAREHRDRVAPFLADVRKLFEDRAGRQIVLVEAEQETVARWIALACASLSDEYARALTFVTRTAQPYEAPQQILGIGPEAEFDREDAELLQHLYRVHDGLGGTGSPPADDMWAKAMAWRWTEGTPPRRPEKGEPFGLDGPLAEGELPSPDNDMWQALADAPEEHPELVRMLTRHARELPLPVGDEPPPVDGLDRLDALIRIRARIADEVPAAELRPFTAELARRRLAWACRGDLPLDRRVLTGLPLDDAARRALYQEFVGAVEDAMHGRLSGTKGPWADAFDLGLHLGGDESPLAREGAKGITEALISQHEELAGPAVEVLERLDSPVVDRLTLQRLAARAAEDARVLPWVVGSPAAGRWLRSRNLSEVPLPVRVAVRAADLRATPERPEGAELFVALARALGPGGRIADAATLNEVWAAAAMPHGQLDPAQAPRLLEACPARLFVETGRGPLFGTWLNRPPEFSRTLLDFATAVRGDPQLPPLGRDMAELLATTAELTVGAVDVARAVARTEVLWPSVGPLQSHVEQAVLTVFARALADADLTAQGARGAYRFLTQETREELLRPYGEAVQARYGTDERLRALAREPQRVASLFLTWHPRTPGDRPEWRAVAETLLHNILGAAVQRMYERDVALATSWVYQCEPREKEAWAQWSYQRRGR